jgi:hypothetical protein
LAEGIAIQFQEEPVEVVAEFSEEVDSIVEVLVAGFRPSSRGFTYHRTDFDIRTVGSHLLSNFFNLCQTGWGRSKEEVVVLPPSKVLKHLDPLRQQMTVTLADGNDETHWS